MSKRKPDPQQPDQRQRFIETAEGLECDQDEAAFRRKLAQVAKQKPKDAKGDGH